MRKLVVFNHVTLDGYFAGMNGDISWFNKDAELNAFAADNASAAGLLLFGRMTYELMASYWPKPYAINNDPIVAERMNSLPKVVFSRTLDKAEWNNTRIVKDKMPDEVQKMKQQTGKDMALLGSGNIIAQLASLGLIDEYRIMVNPVAIGKGRTMFEGIKDRLALKLTKTQTFGNGNVLLCYEPIQ
jgi:dihydrofolate reductase